MHSPTPMRRFRSGRTALVLACGLVGFPLATWAQQGGNGEGGAARTVLVEPRVSVTQTFTDNVKLSSTASRSEQITQISPGVRITGERGRIKGYFDFSVSEFLYAQNSSPARSQRALSTFGTLEAIDNWAFIDVNGSISQQSISAFGTPTGNGAAINNNQTEVSAFRVSPYLRGRLGDVASYEARYSRSDTRSGTAAASNIATDSVSVSLTSASAFQRLGWTASASQQNVDYSAGRATDDDRLTLGLSYAVTPQLRVSVNAGREANNFTSLVKKTYDTGGVGVVWTPSEMTKLSASRDERSFGPAHSVNLEHRTARTVWRYTDSRDVVTQPDQAGFAGLGSVYDLLYSQFASREPEPTARAQLVNTFMQANGIGANAVAVGTFLTSALTLQRRQNLTFILLGLRDTVTFTATRSDSSRLDTVLSTIADDFTSTTVIHQRGFSVNYLHRLTPDQTLGFLVAQQNTSGTVGGQDSRLRTFNVNLTGKISKRSTASVGYRHAIYSSTAPYIENAIFGTLIFYF